MAAAAAPAPSPRRWRSRTWRAPLRRLGLAIVVAVAAPAAIGEPTLFDAHLHYKSLDADALPPEQIIALLRTHGTQCALITGTPPELVDRLYAAAPERIVPMLGVYQHWRDKEDWLDDATLPAQVETDLARGIYRAIGELHVFANDRAHPVLLRIAELAAERGLVLMVHGDIEVIDTLLARFPELVILWAHLGTDPRPEAIRAALTRHPTRLYADTSVRDARFTDRDGRLRADWRALFVDHSERIVIGVDTFWTRRWRQYGQVADEIRAWLTQLPEDVQTRLAFSNAHALFAPNGAPQTCAAARRTRPSDTE